MNPTLPNTLCQRQMLAADLQVRRALEGDTATLEVYDLLIADALAAAYDELQRYCRIRFSPTIVVTRPDDSLVRGTDYDLGEDYYDITGFGAGRIQTWTTRWRPIISVERIALEASPQRRLLTLPSSWLRIDHKLGQIQVVPLVGAVAYEGMGFDVWLPMLYGGYLKGVMPQFARIDYTCGLPTGVWAVDEEAVDAEAQAVAWQEWAEVRIAVGRRAAIDVLASVPQLIASSGSIDGGSMNVMDVGTQMDRLQKGVDDFKAQWAAQNAPLRVRFA